MLGRPSGSPESDLQVDGGNHEGLDGWHKGRGWYVAREMSVGDRVEAPGFCSAPKRRAGDENSTKLTI